MHWREHEGQNRGPEQGRQERHEELTHLVNKKEEETEEKNGKEKYTLQLTEDKFLKFWLETENKDATEVFVILNGRVYEGVKEYLKQWEYGMRSTVFPGRGVGYRR